MVFVPHECQLCYESCLTTKHLLSTHVLKPLLSLSGTTYDE